MDQLFNHVSVTSVARRDSHIYMELNGTSPVLARLAMLLFVVVVARLVKGSLNLPAFFGAAAPSWSGRAAAVAARPARHTRLE